DHADAARYEVAAAHHPLGALLTRDPDVLGHGIRLLGLDVGGAVFEAEQVARRGLARRGRRGATEAELRPAQIRAPEGDAAEVADGVHRHLRVVGTRLDAQVAAAVFRHERVAREAGERLERGRAAVAETEAVD